MQRYFIYLAYDGTNYHGWQIQPNGCSVQECLMKALSTFLRREVEVVGAGRTDAGVHASLMVAHFDNEEELDDIATDNNGNIFAEGTDDNTGLNLCGQLARKGDDTNGQCPEDCTD